jgi:transposase
MSLQPRPQPEVPELTARVARAAFPNGALAMRMRDSLGSLFADEEFAGLFGVRGRPGLSPGQLALVSVLQFAENLSDRQAADAVRGRIEWKYALGLELDDPGFDFTVLTGFRARLIGHGHEERVLELLLERLGELGFLRAGGRQRTDSTHVLAAVRSLNRSEFVGEVMRSALNVLAAVEPEWLAVWAPREWQKRYGARVDSYRLPAGEAARAEYLTQVGGDGYLLLERLHAPDSPAWLRQVPAVQILREAWIQQYHRQDGEVRVRQGEDLPPGRLRLASPYDPDARYGVKRQTGWTGYKVHLTETCESDAPHLITYVATTDATVGDSDLIPVIHDGLAERGLLPDEHVVDSGYTGAALVVQAHDEHQVELLGPLGANTSRQSSTGGGFDQTHFTIDWDNQQVTCPQGQVSSAWRTDETSRGLPVVQVSFRKNDCGPCPVRAQCTKAKTTPRKLTFRPREQYEILEKARREQTTKEWKQRYNVRAGVEGTIAQTVHVTGTRRTRYTGLDKTHLASIFAACAINLIRIDAWLTGTPPGTTRNSRFTELELAA